MTNSTRKTMQNFKDEEGTAHLNRPTAAQKYEVKSEEEGD